MTGAGARYRALTQTALWLLFGCGAGLFLARAPIQVAFKLWSIGAAGLSLALLAEVEREPAFRRLANSYGLLLAATVSLAAIQLLDHPFLALCAIAAPVAALIAARAPGPTRVAALTVTVLATAFGSAEAVEMRLLARGEMTTEVVDRQSGLRIETNSFAVPDAVRGFAGRPNSVVKVRFSESGAPVYDVTYTLDARGRRETPGVAPGPVNLIFLGDSFAFGEGVADGETAPAQLARMATGLRPVNLGFKAYGPHQALATLEAGLETDLVPAGTAAAGIYYASFDVSRAAGRAFWDWTGPHYELTPEGRLEPRGAFSADWRLRAIRFLNRSYLLREIVRKRLNGEGDLRLFVAILERTSRLFRERHGGPFLVLLWGEAEDRGYLEAARLLRARGVEVATVQEIVQDFESSRAALTLGDQHPNREGQLRVAQYLERWLARRP